MCRLSQKLSGGGKQLQVNKLKSEYNATSAILHPVFPLRCDIREK